MLMHVFIVIKTHAEHRKSAVERLSCLNYSHQADPLESISPL